MQLFSQPFDANTVKPQEAFDPLPDGWYILAIRNSEAKPTKDNESGYLSFELEVIDGEHKGRKVFDNLNLWNKSVQASEIAQRQLSAYCHATGVLVLNDSTQLHGIPVKAKIGTKSDAGYEPRNVIKAVKHVQDSTANTAPTAAPFGQNPALPAMPVPPPNPQGGAFVPSVQGPAVFAQQPTQQAPAQSPPWPAQSPPWAPQGPVAVPTAPTGAPVPPWRR